MIQLPIHKQNARRSNKIRQEQGVKQRKEVILIEDSDEDHLVPNSQIRPPLQTHYYPRDLQFLEVPTIRLTEELMNDPYRLIDDLYAKQFDKVGMVKLVPPKHNRNAWATLKSKLGSKRLVTRRQEVRNLTDGKPFVQNQQGYSMDEYCQMAQKFQQSYTSQVPKMTDDLLRQNELEFWSLVDFNFYKPVVVEYAADLLVNKYASAFENDDVILNLNRVNKLRDGMFQLLTQEMSGISVPWLYLGMKFASFCWHCEDLFLNSLNYMHAGAPKTWYAIPPSSSERFNEVFAKKYDLKNNPRQLYDITTMISPTELQRERVNILRTDQYPGELILTFGPTYHAGFSHGLNCSEAVNIAPVQWLDEYSKAVEQYRKHGNSRKVSFPLEWLVVKIVKNHQQASFTKGKLQLILNRFQAIRSDEMKFRNEVKKLYQNITFYDFKNPDERYDKNICKICTDYMYLSYLYCNKCLSKGCLHHQSICMCVGQKMSVYQRYTEEDLLKMGDRLAHHLS